MSADVTIDFTEAEMAIGSALEEMAALTQLPVQKIVKAEAASVLRYCASATKLKTEDQVTPRARAEAIRHLELNRGDVTINSGFRHPNAVGRIWARSNGPRSKRRYRMAYGVGTPVGRPLDYHWKDRDWTDIQEAKFDYERLVAKYTKNAVRSIGLALQSWVQVADALGIHLESVHGARISASRIAAARQATSRFGKQETNGAARESKDAENYFVEIVNRLPYAEKVGMGATLHRAIYGRVRYFAESVSHGVFEAVSEVARRYPGFEITAGGDN